MIICIEGADGVGKTSVAESLGLPVVSFPNYLTETGKIIRQVLRGAIRMDPLVFQCLQTVNKLETTVHGDTILCRYWPSAYVYGVLDGLPRQWLMDVHKGMKADRYILLDASAESCAGRQTARGGQREMYEGRIGKTQRIRELYLELWHNMRWPIVDAERPLESVIQDVKALTL